MVEENKKSGKGYKKGPGSTYRQSAKPTVTAPIDQAATPSPAGEAEQAIAQNEFALILTLLGTAGRQMGFSPSEGKCKDHSPIWCLPNVSCTAQVTFTDEAKKAFEANEKCLADQKY